MEFISADALVSQGKCFQTRFTGASQPQRLNFCIGYDDKRVIESLAPFSKPGRHQPHQRRALRWGTQCYCYGAAVLSVIATLIISLWLDSHMITSAPIALFLCAIMVSTWYGGLKPGFLAMVLSLLAFKYYYLPPVHSLTVEIHEIPRLLINILAAFFVVSLGAAQRKATELLKHARNVLDGTLQDLKRATSHCRRRTPCASGWRRSGENAGASVDRCDPTADMEWPARRDA